MCCARNVVVRRHNTRSSWRHLSIFVCHPLTISSVWSLVESGSECLEEAEAGKRRKYKSVLPDVDNCFSVFGVSTFGKLSLGAEQLLEEIISCYSTDVSCVEEVELNRNRIMQQLGMILYRELARMLLVGVRDLMVDPMEGVG